MENYCYYVDGRLGIQNSFPGFRKTLLGNMFGSVSSHVVWRSDSCSSMSFGGLESRLLCDTEDLTKGVLKEKKDTCC